MHKDTLRALETAVRRSHAGEIHFGQLVPLLLDLGVESYRVDYRRGDTTYHWTTGAMHVLTSHGAEAPIPEHFDAPAVRAAILASQRGDQRYDDFVRRTLAAGCVGYDAWLTGRNVVYHGRRGERWVEWFPGALALRQAVEVVQAVYAAFARRDLAAVLDLCAADVELLQSREVPWGGHYRGHAEVRTFFARLGERIDSTLALDRFIDAGDRVVAVGRTCGAVRATGRRYDVPVAHTWTVQGGRITRAEFDIDNPVMLAALT